MRNLVNRALIHALNHCYQTFFATSQTPWVQPHSWPMMTSPPASTSSVGPVPVFPPLAGKYRCSTLSWSFVRRQEVHVSRWHSQEVVLCQYQ